MYRRFAHILVPLMFSWASLASAQIYKWVDEYGNVQFSDKPPAEGAEEIKLKDSATPDPELQQHREKQQRLLEVMEEERAESAENKRKLAEQQARNRANCDRATRQLEEMRKANYLFEETGDPDNPRVLSNAERTAATAKAEGEQRRWCN